MNYLEIKSLLIGINDPVQKLEMVMDFGRDIEKIPDGVKTDLITGCVSRVEIYHDEINNRFYGSSDSPLVRGVLHIILSMVQGKKPSEIKEIGLSGEFASLGLQLGSGRLTGVASMIRFLESL